MKITNGLSPFNIIMFLVILLGGGISYGALQSQVNNNTEAIKTTKQETKEIIKETEQRIREDLKELRQIIIRDIKSRNKIR